MAQEKELEIQRQFLDEAQAYLSTLESALLGLSDNRIDAQKINAALRATHSIKGGAGMMGFHALSDLAHQLEDSLKVLKTQKQSLTIEPDLENLLLASVDCLGHVIRCDREACLRGDRLESAVDLHWLATQAKPIFAQLHERLGDPQAEDATSVLSPEDNQDILPILFETEVEGCLQRLEAVLAAPDQPCLREELAILAQELGGLGEMLQLSAFSQLCGAVETALAHHPDDVITIAIQSLQAWRRSQSLVLTQQLDLLPTTIDYAGTAVESLVSAADCIDLGTATVPDSQSFDSAFGDTVTWAQTETVVTSTARSQMPPQPQPAQPPRSAMDFDVLAVKADDVSASVDEDVDATVRVSVKQLNQLNDLLGELTIERNALDLYLKRMQSLSRTLKQRVQALDQIHPQVQPTDDRTAVLKSDTAPVPQRENTDRSQSDDFDALELDRYDDRHLMSQQITEMMVQIQEVSSDIELSLDDAEQTTRQLNKTARQMHSGLTQMRMRPLSDVVDRFPRALRELCLTYGKKVTFTVSGSQTLIDRTILEALNDPLMHLLRNAFDHGIEEPETRLACGKPEEGTIEIRAFHQGNHTVITFRDDGKGISVAKIRAKATQMGLDPVLLAAATDEELLSLIFEPGFSTTEQVTTLSGRGVGMDVVRNSLRQIRGDIAVSTAVGSGTTFTITVPFTLSVVRVLLVACKGVQLAIPADVINEMVVLPPESVMQTMGREVFAWGETIVPLIVLSRWLQFHSAHSPVLPETPPTINVPSVLITHSGDQRVGLQVDRCWGEQEVAIRRVEGLIPMPQGFTNCTVLGDGCVVPLVNVPELLHWIASHRSVTPALAAARLAPDLMLSPAPTKTSAHSRKTVLVVDDSINVRRFLALTLEKAGYQVEQAKDGQDAIEKLEKRPQPVQAVICDIEMPRLDGYGFLAKVRANTALTELPIIMLTSRSGSKHRQLAMSLGATAYFSKPYNEQALLSSLEQMVSVGVPV